MRFVDTNVLLYAISRDPEEQTKQGIAHALLGNRDLALSAQVLQEFYVQATRASRDDALTHRQSADPVLAFTRFPVQPTTVRLVLAAMDTSSRFGVSYWHASIIEAARMLGCAELLSEDLNQDQDYAGLVVVDPFR